MTIKRQIYVKLKSVEGQIRIGEKLTLNPPLLIANERWQ